MDLETRVMHLASDVTRTSSSLVITGGMGLRGSKRGVTGILLFSRRANRRCRLCAGIGNHYNEYIAALIVDRVDYSNIAGTMSTSMADQKQNAPATDKSKAATNPRGIPYAPFVDRVEDYVTSRSEVEPTLRSFQEMISKYQFMELNLQRRVAGLKDKLPDIEKTLDTVRFLKARRHSEEPLHTHYELNDSLYAQAIIPPKTEEVYLWLGANVMLAYPLDEAEELLEGKLKVAKQSLENHSEDLDFLREQITTMEVAIARVYNWEVVQKRKEKTQDSNIGGGTGEGKGKEMDLKDIVIGTGKEKSNG